MFRTQSIYECTHRHTHFYFVVRNTLVIYRKLAISHVHMCMNIIYKCINSIAIKIAERGYLKVVDYFNYFYWLMNSYKTNNYIMKFHKFLYLRGRGWLFFFLHFYYFFEMVPPVLGCKHISRTECSRLASNGTGS